MRRVKTLGTNKNFKVLRPGEYTSVLPRTVITDTTEDDDDASTNAEVTPAFEPLVLWEDSVSTTLSDNITDGSEIEQEGNSEGHVPLPTSGAISKPHKIEVVASLASKLRPHQREGVQFLFDCVMGVKGYAGEGCILADDMGLGKYIINGLLCFCVLS